MKLGEEMDDFTKKSTEQFDKSTVKQAERLIDKSPELKRIRSIKDGEKFSEISTGVNDQQYKDNYDKIKWSKNKNKKPGFKMRINGEYVDNDE